MQTLEKCTLYTQTPETWRAGEVVSTAARRGTRRTTRGQKVLRAIDVQTGTIAWELPQIGAGAAPGAATLATAGGLVFFGEDGGALTAVDAASGAPLWQFQTNAQWNASPMTYVFDGQQYVAVAAGPSILAFALMD